MTTLWHRACGTCHGMATVRRADAAHADPLVCVDLAHLLVTADPTWECAARVLRRQPWALLGLPAWRARGRARLREELARRADLDPAALPYRDDAVQALRARHAAGERLVLASSADPALVRGVARHLGIFDAVVTGDAVPDAGDPRRRPWLVQRLGRDTVEDLAEPPPRTRPADVVAALRLHQWVKNVLVFLPFLLAHHLTVALLGRTALATLAFCLCASAVYVLNDVVDLDADRAHPRKRRRPVAAGRLPIPLALGLVPAALAAAFGLAALLPPAFLAVLAGYVGLTTAYSFVLKRMPVVDVLTLALLYVSRIFAGAVAVELAVSPWLLAVSLFLFHSLATLKRHSEIGVVAAGRHDGIAGRGYVGGDRPWLAASGLASGYLAPLVLALYITSDDVVSHYRRPAVLWAACVILLGWVGHVWLLAHRDRIVDDPVVVAARDPVSYVVALALTLTLLLAL